MNRLFQSVTALALIAAGGMAAAQTSDDSQVILPLEAQNCNLPAAPARIPAEADLPQLAKAKTAVQNFQQEMVGYRECLEESRRIDILTQGNEVALTEAHNYSVEMEERIAEQFNAAVREYKARQAAKPAEN